MAAPAVKILSYVLGIYKTRLCTGLCKSLSTQSSRFASIKDSSSIETLFSVIPPLIKSAINGYNSDEVQQRAIRPFGMKFSPRKICVLWDFVFGSYSQYNNKEQVSLL